MRHPRFLSGTVLICFFAASQSAVGADIESDPGPEAAAETTTDLTNSDDAIANSELPPELVQLRNKIRQCLLYYHQRPEDASDRSPWGVMHSAVAFGVDTELNAQGRKVNALGWLCWNLPCRGQRFFYTSGGELQTRHGTGVQGHPGQLLAVLAQSRVREDFQIKASGYEFTVADLIEHEKKTCAAGTELTFKLIALSHYLDTDATWKDEDGDEWSIPRLIKEELTMPVATDAACGGTHRMMGFSYAVNKREKRGEPMTGQWRRAQKFVEDFHEYTFELQNADGTFSTDWFRGRAADRDIDRRLQTTGHSLEWLAYSLPKEELREERVVKAVNYLTDLMLEHRNRDWSIGPKGHALHGLVIYDQRMFGSKPGQGPPQLPAGVEPVEALRTPVAVPEAAPDSGTVRRGFFARRRR